MHFIKSCTGKFDDAGDQLQYDTQIGVPKSFDINKYILDELNLRLSRKDPHFEIFSILARVAECRWNLYRNATLIMTGDVFEYALKHVKKPKKDSNKEEFSDFLKEISGLKEFEEREKSSFQKAKDRVRNVFKSKYDDKAYLDQLEKMMLDLSEKVSFAASELGGSQNAKDMWEYFNKFTDDGIRKSLMKRGVHNREILDGLMEFRRLYGFFLSKLNDVNTEYMAMQKKYPAEVLDAANVRWAKIYNLLQELCPLKVDKSQDTVSAQGLFSESDPCVKLEKELNEILGEPVVKPEFR